jgi:hypothetical protein
MPWLIECLIRVTQKDFQRKGQSSNKLIAIGNEQTLSTLRKKS